MFSTRPLLWRYNGPPSMIVMMQARGLNMWCRLPAQVVAIPFDSAADEFCQDSDDSSTLILVQLHWRSRLFPDVYFEWYNQHFTIMHDSGKPFNMGHPQRFVGALLHNAYPDGDKPSPKAKLPPAFLDQSSKFPIDSCTRSY